MIEDFQNHILHNKGAEVWILREKYTDLTDSTIPDFFRLWNPLFFHWPGNADKSFNKQDHRVKTINNGEIKFRSADRPRGMQSVDHLSYFGIEEAPDVKEETFDFLLTRPRRKDIPLRRVLVGYVPDTSNWVYDRFWKSEDPRFRKFIFPKECNKHNLVERYYKDLYLDYADKPDWVKRYLEAEPVFIGRGDPEFPGFDRRVHVMDDILSAMGDRPIFRGWDYGFDWSAVTFAQINPFDQLVILGAMVGHNMDVATFAPIVQERGMEWFGNVDYEDYGAGDGEYKSPQSRFSVHEQLAQRSIHPKFKESYPGCVEDGLNVIRRLLLPRGDHRTGIVFCGPRCGMLIDAMAGGLAKDSQGRPDKACRPHLDLVDSLRNMVVNLYDPAQQRQDTKPDSIDERYPRVMGGRRP